MKKTLLTILFAVSVTISFSQELRGTWGGIIFTSLDSYPRNYYLFMEVKQIGRDVWAVYNITDTNNNTISKCLGKVKAVLPKKSSALLDFYNEGLVKYQEKPDLRTSCEMLTQMSMHYFIDKDSTEYLTGTWYPGVPSSRTEYGSLLVLQRMSEKTFRDVDDYFSALANTKPLAEYKPSIIPDKVSAALLPEKRLIDALKKMVENNLSIKTH